MRLGSVVRAGVVAVCLAPCVVAGLLAAVRVNGSRANDCHLAPEEETLEPLEPERKSGALAMVKMGFRSVALVADTDAQEIVAFDVGDAKVLARSPVGGSPSHVLFARTANGERRLYVTHRDANKVKVFDVRPRGVACGEDEPLLAPLAELKTADEPVAMAIAPDAKTVFVVSGWGHALEGFSTVSHDKVFDAPVAREPRAVVIDAAGARAFVSHAVGSGVTVVNLRPEPATRTIALDGKVGPLFESRDGSTEGRPQPTLGVGLGMFSDVSARVSFAGGGKDSFGGEAALTKPRPPGPRTAGQGFALASLRSSSGAERFFVPEVLVDPGEMPVIVRPETRPSGYGGGGGGGGIEQGFSPTVFHVAVIEAASETATTKSMTLMIDDTSCLLPRAAAIDPSRRTLLVACLGTNEIDEYDTTNEVPTMSLRGRWKVPAGPTGIAVDEERIVVWSSFDHVLTVIARSGDVRHASATSPREPTPFEVGRKIFHASGNRDISADGRACASCHPDGRDDGLTWTSPDGPRQTPMLAGRLAESAPFGWTGTSSTVRDHLKQTLRRLHGDGLGDRSTYALLTYLAQMKTPHRTPKGDPAKVARGGKIFRSYEAGCSSCHLNGERPIGDGETHDVGSAGRGDVFASLGTPSLQFVGGTGPYFHDGRYATLPELLRATDGKMGSTSHLDAADFEALTTYLESL